MISEQELSYFTG